MRQVTLCVLVREDEVCLALKKRGFGEGKWNGVGGKVQEGERVEAAALREMQEEIGVSAREEDLEKVATIDFTFDGKPEFDQTMHAFLVRAWEGEPVESEEMRPHWYALADIPYDAMWIDDPLWLPHVLAGKKVEARFRFSADGGTILEQSVAAR